MLGSVNFDRAADFYDATRAFPDSVAERVGPFLAEATQLSGDESVLEVGIGTGRIALPLAPFVSSIYGADISLKMLQRLVEKRGDEEVFPAIGDAHTLPYAENSFDVVLVTHVFHLVEDPVAVLAEIGRVLKPDGFLLHTFGSYANSKEMLPIVNAWRDNSVPTPRPVKWSNIDDFFPENGWQVVRSDELKYEYHTSPAEFLERVEKRQWSSTWHVSDAELARGVDAIKAAIDKHFDGEGDAPTLTTSTYTAQVIQPKA
ncbi:MAG: hypothetical protein CL607_05325 [Anaerolineaceae bacterium]|nr:hypothetical protein [Anaerolineaceae bacterium]